jgi:hypothetical protein
VAGETPLVTFMPLQPTPSSNKAETPAESRKTFQFNLTKTYYNFSRDFGNI